MLLSPAPIQKNENVIIPVVHDFLKMAKIDRSQLQKLLPAEHKESPIRKLNSRKNLVPHGTPQTPRQIST